MPFERKLNRKQSKYKSILRNDYGILTDNSPSRYLMLCNAGLVNNCEKKVVVDIFQRFGKIDSVVMPEGKSYSFVSFVDEVCAEACYRELNCTRSLPCLSGPLYLLYLDEMPPDDRSSKFGEYPPGLRLLEDFVDETEETLLLDAVKLNVSSCESSLKNRLVKHFGYEFLYNCNNVDRNRPLEEKIPGECDLIFDRLKELLPDIIEWTPDQLTVNRYDPGHGIPPHIDTHSAFLDPLLSLSLGSDIVMDFKRGSKTISVLLPRRSLLVLSGESRYAWSHGICGRKSDVVPHKDGGLTVRDRSTRTSLTFRRIRHDPCDCAFESYCDSRNQKSDITEEAAHSLEKSYVHDVYCKISQHFSSTRHKPWPNVLDFITSYPSGSIVVDIGCGNGKYFGHSKGIVELGLDRCYNLIRICRERGYEGIVSDCLALPLRSEVADCVICIAVIHHLATEARRIRALQEMVRVARIGGRILIYSWAKDQVAGDRASSYLKQSRKNRKIDVKRTGDYQQSKSLEIECFSSDSNKVNLKLPLHENRTEFKHKDLLVPWKMKTREDQHSFPTFLRFYHVFEQQELYDLCSKINSVRIEKSYYDQGNWCVILTKIQ